MLRPRQPVAKYVNVNLELKAKDRKFWNNKVISVLHVTVSGGDEDTQRRTPNDD